MTREQFMTHVEGSQRAFRRFLVALCCGDSALADDIAQESYVKAYLSIDSLKDPGRFNAWLYRIGYTTFVNSRRAERPTVGYDEVPETPAHETADAAFRYDELYAALDRLPDKERTSILLFYLEDYAIKEIAAIVGASESAVKQHLSRGRNHLRGLLTKENI